MSTMALFVIGGVLIGASAVVAMIRAERAKRQFLSDLLPPAPPPLEQDWLADEDGDGR